MSRAICRSIGSCRTQRTRRGLGGRREITLDLIPFCLHCGPRGIIRGRFRGRGYSFGIQFLFAKLRDTVRVSSRTKTTELSEPKVSSTEGNKGTVKKTKDLLTIGRWNTRVSDHD